MVDVSVTPRGYFVETSTPVTHLMVNGQELKLTSSYIPRFDWSDHGEFNFWQTGGVQDLRSVVLPSECRPPIAFYRGTPDANKITSAVLQSKETHSPKGQNEIGYHLVRFLADAGFYEQALSLTGKIDSMVERAAAMALIAARKQDPALLDKSLAIAKNNPNKNDRANALGAIASQLAIAKQWDQAVTVAAMIDSAIQLDQDYTVQEFALRNIALWAVDKGSYEVAFSTVGKIQNPLRRASVLSFTISTMIDTDKQLAHQALAALLYQFQNLDSRANDYSFESVAGALAMQKEYKYAIYAVEKIKDPKTKARALVSVEVLAGSVAKVQTIIDQFSGFQKEFLSMHGVRQLISVDLLTEAVVMAEKNMDSHGKDTAFSEIAGAQAKKGQYDSAVAVSKKINDPFRADGAVRQVVAVAAEAGDYAKARGMASNVEDVAQRQEVLQAIESAEKATPKWLKLIGAFADTAAAIKQDPSWSGLVLFCY